MTHQSIVDVDTSQFLKWSPCLGLTLGYDENKNESCELSDTEPHLQHVYLKNRKSLSPCFGLKKYIDTTFAQPLFLSVHHASGGSLLMSAFPLVSKRQQSPARISLNSETMFSFLFPYPCLRKLYKCRKKYWMLPPALQWRVIVRGWAVTSPWHTAELRGKFISEAIPHQISHLSLALPPQDRICFRCLFSFFIPKPAFPKALALRELI